ncbi:MAG: diguanylate cyclase [Micropepsaceae bacterium]
MIPPTPVNYELWFFYALGQDRDLCRALDAAVENGSAVNSVRAKEIHTRFFVRPDHRIEQASATMQKELGQLASALTTVGEGATVYGKALGVTQAELKNVNHPSDFLRVVNNAATATLQMEERNKLLEAQVESSSRELDALQKKLEIIRQESRIDALTELANRREFDERIESAIENAVLERKPLCVLMCDIDHFKTFNDTRRRTFVCRKAKRA